MSLTQPTAFQADQLRELTAKDEPTVRTSLLQDQLADLQTPLVYLMEDDGFDLHAILWEQDPNDASRLAFRYNHLQYETTSEGLPDVRLIASSQTPESVHPRGTDDQSLLEMSQKLVDRYQTLRYADPALRPQIHYQQSGVLHPGQTPQLTIPGTSTDAPQWETLLETMSQQEKEIKMTTATPQPDMVVNHEEVRVLMYHLDNDPEFVQTVESLAQQASEGHTISAATYSQMANNLAAKAASSEHMTVSPQSIEAVQKEIEQRVEERVQFLGDVKKEAPVQDKPAKHWPRVNVPNAFAHPYTFTAKDGRQFDKMIINMPNGTKLNGLDVSGWSLDRFMGEEARNDKANGRPVTLTFQPDKELELFKGKGETRKTVVVKDPWTLATALKTARQEYAKAKEAERNAPQVAVQNTLPEPSAVQPERHDEMQGREFFIPFTTPEGETHYAKATTDGLNAWNVAYQPNDTTRIDMGRVVRSEDGTYTAYTPTNPQGTKTVDPISAARITVASSGIAHQVPGDINKVTPPTQTATAPKVEEPVKGDKKSFLEQMNDVTQEKFAGKKFGDDVTQNLAQKQEPAVPQHHTAR